VALPHGFLEELAAKCDGLEAVLRPVGEPLQLASWPRPLALVRPKGAVWGGAGQQEGMSRRNGIGSCACAG
jgi:hypothetical protein